MSSKIRRVVTGHDKNGKAVVLFDGAAGNVRFREATGLTSTLLWVTDSVPADISGREDAADRQIGVPPPKNGTLFRIVEFPPEKMLEKQVDNEAMLKEMGIKKTPDKEEGPRHPTMHRTQSIDYAVVISGEIDMMLDDSEVHLKAGDVVVQQGTNHAWVNNGDASCIMAFALIDAEPLAET